jgi:type II secretory pathway pseudopilin PulG
MLSKKQKQKNFLFKKKSWGKAGFTLVEILVVSAIVILMAGALISVVANRNKPATEVESAAEQLVSKLKNLQNNAVNGDTSNDGLNTICSFSFFTGPRAETDNDAGRYALVETPCAPVGLSTSVVGFLTSGDNNKVTASAATATFSVPFGAVSGSTSVTLTVGTEDYFVCIAVGGLVSGETGQANIYASKDGCP